MRRRPPWAGPLRRDVPLWLAVAGVSAAYVGAAAVALDALPAWVAVAIIAVAAPTTFITRPANARPGDALVWLADSAVLMSAAALILRLAAISRS